MTRRNDTTPPTGIELAGTQGFGAGVCLRPLPRGMEEMSGTRDPAADHYGNYQYQDGSIMRWRPAYYLKVGTGANGLPLNVHDIKDVAAFADVATANAAGYMLDRVFYDGGIVQPGYFEDKYLPSTNGGIASSLKNGL